jgi:hypothetical protein
VPFPAHLSRWAGMPTIWTIVLVLAMMSFGFYAARAGQRYSERLTLEV